MDPPPPPPHGNGDGGRSSGLPPGNYDIFIIPPHSSGSGFLYLPSLQPQRNSFIAGFICAVAGVAIWQVMYPILKEWFATMVASGGVGVIMMLVGVGVVGWAWGKTQTETGRPGEGSAGGSSHKFFHGGTAGGPSPNTTGGMPYGGMPTGATPMPDSGAGVPPNSSWERGNAGPPNANGNARAGAGKSEWEKAREETRKREEYRKRAEEIRKKREEEEKEKQKQRDKETRERELREAREKREAEAKERREKEAREKLEAEIKELRDKEAKQRKEQETKQRREQEVKERREREAKLNARNAAETASSAARSETSRPSSPPKRHQPPTAKTEKDDDASHSFRPYDKPKRPIPKADSASSIYSESSYAPSQSTARTTPPPSHRGPYHTKDPDKIVIKAVYSFNNAFTKLPIAQLVSGIGSVTDGLILRITSEGLFIDDDVRSVPQREWDVKAWTLKLVEVWCPHFQISILNRNPAAPAAAGRSAFFGIKSAAKAPAPEEIDATVADFLTTCKMHCFGASRVCSPVKTRSNANASPQTGEQGRLHVLRASIRDQEGKKYVFILQEEEGWKVAIGLQRLRRGTQVRALGVSGMPANEAKSILDNMGWV